MSGHVLPRMTMPWSTVAGRSFTATAANPLHLGTHGFLGSNWVHKKEIEALAVAHGIGFEARDVRKVGQICIFKAVLSATREALSL